MWEVLSESHWDKIKLLEVPWKHLFQIAGRIQFLVVVGTRSLFSFWLWAEGHFYLPEATCIPWLVASFHLKWGKRDDGLQVLLSFLNLSCVFLHILWTSAKKDSPILRIYVIRLSHLGNPKSSLQLKFCP